MGATLAVVVGVSIITLGLGVLDLGGSSTLDVAKASEAPRADRGTEVLGEVLERPAEPETPAPVSTGGDAPIAQAPTNFEVQAGVAASPPVKPPARLRNGGEGGTWALVVGINDYPGDAADLRFAVNDADDVDATLARFDVEPGRRLVLRNGEATADSIRAGLAWLAERAGPDALAVVSFAGHARRNGPDRHAFVAADGVELSDRELAERLRPLRSSKVWLNFATCFGGGFNELLAPGRLLTAAAPADEIAYESTAIGRSYLGEYMIRRGLLTPGSNGSIVGAFNAARDAIARDYPDRVPVIIAGADAGQITLRSGAQTKASSGSPSPKASSETPQPSGESSSAAPAPAPAPDNRAPAPEPKRDGCSDLTLGAVTCNS